jgi:hypothetical protein
MIAKIPHEIHLVVYFLQVSSDYGPQLWRLILATISRAAAELLFGIDDFRGW